MTITFPLTLITAPSLGNVVGGLLTTKFLGSYKNDNALALCFVLYSLLSASCIPCPFINDYETFIILIWLAAFFYGFILPILMGIILTSVTEIERPAASSLSILFEMLFGKFPAPYVYSLVYEWTKNLDDKGNNISRGGMYTIFFSIIIGLIFLAVALPLRKYSIKASESRTRKEIKKEHPEATE